MKRITKTALIRAEKMRPAAQTASLVTFSNVEQMNTFSSGISCNHKRSFSFLSGSCSRSRLLNSPRRNKDDHYHGFRRRASAAATVETSNSETTAASTVPNEGPENITLDDFVSSLESITTWKDIESRYQFSQADGDLEDAEFCKSLASCFEETLDRLCKDEDNDFVAVDMERLHQLLSASNVHFAFGVLIRADFDTALLSRKVRDWERYIGKLKWTPLTDQLSLQLLIANAKAANVGRVFSILQLRKDRAYPPCQEEFTYAIRALKIANMAQHMKGIRNIFLSDNDQPAVDNPTRWLDSILLNMAHRDFPLTTGIANRMLDCYGSGGKSGKAVHHFYRVVRQGILSMPPEERPVDTDEMPKEWVYDSDSQQFAYQPVKVKVKYHKQPPPFYKVPSQVKGKLLYRSSSKIGKLKFDREVEPEYSLPLAAAFAFADSLEHGACGHKPIDLDVGSYNALIKASVCRGALWRAKHVLETTMPAAGIVPNQKSYNFLLLGLAAVGDVATGQEVYMKMHNGGVKPDSFTVRAIADGLLNVGDAHGAVTVVQDFFNQHSVLPPIWMHCKLLELCLGQGLVYEAKRYVFFIQQLWKWEPNQYHDESFVKLMQETQRDPSIQRQALVKLFAYFGEELNDTDFF